MKYQIIEKFYSKDDNLFYIVKENKSTLELMKKTYNSFDKFYNALNGNLENANLLDYNFKNINLRKYNLTNAQVSPEVQDKINSINPTYKLITKDCNLSSFTPSVSKDLTPIRQLKVEDIDDDSFILCYISDLHLNHKLLKKITDITDGYKLWSFMQEVVEKLKNSLPSPACDDYNSFPINHARIYSNYSVVFIGDISYNFEIFKLFFTVYRKELPYLKTFVILGNHELWDTKLNKECNSIEELIEQYRNFLNTLKINLLENQLFLPNDDQNIYSQEEILTLDKNILRQKFLCNSYAIFGGIGYAGINEEFNANHDIYKTNYITREQEKEKSNQIESLHKRLTEIAGDKKVFFITHMPKEDWSKSDYNKNWFYVSGHTHKNKYIENEKLKFYADNQVGYDGNSYGFKYLTTSNEFDIFQDYSDGIYEITRDQYKLFYDGIGNRINFNRDFEKLFMLKRNGIYCFLIKLNNNDDLKLLNGGSVKNVGKHDIKYFYENLANYANSIKLFLQSYDNFEKQISNEVKKFGGSGIIHGCIIDIDYYNHLYINPIDATITPYYALSKSHKYVYKNLISLLKVKNKDLLNKYVSLINDQDNTNSQLVLSKNTQKCSRGKFVPDTDIYRISKIIKTFQYTTKNNVVRLWNDTIASNCSKECGKLIIDSIINPVNTKE